MRHDLLIAGLAALASVFAAPVAATAPEEYDADKVLATVDGDEITLGHRNEDGSRVAAFVNTLAPRPGLALTR